MVQKGLQNQAAHQDGHHASPEKASPTKTVFGSLGKPRVSQEPVHRNINMMNQTVTEHVNDIKKAEQTSTIPTRIEDVPFRRQDRRILNARKKRMMDRKLYKCILITGFLLVVIGAGLLFIHIFKHSGKKTNQVGNFVRRM